MLPKSPFPTLFTRNRQHYDEDNFFKPVSITIREPLPLDQARSSVARLPDHVMRRILVFLQYLCPEDLLTVASLSSFLYEQARYVQHHVVHIDLDKSRHIHNRLSLIIYRGLLPAIRTLKVSGQDFDKLQKEGKGILTRLAEMLCDMTGLRDFDWQVERVRKIGFYKERIAVPIPVPILESLPPGAWLHTSVFCTDEDESHAQGREFLNRLTNNQHLRTLSIQVFFFKERECLETMRALKKVLLSCPNLTRIPLLDVSYPREGCDVYATPPGSPYHGLGLSNGERPPALEELGLREYPWGAEGGIYCQGYPEKGFERDYWARIFDWSQLTRLNDMPSDMLSRIAPRMTGLEELILEHYDSQKVNLDEIISPLKLLSISSWYRVDNKSGSINRYGATLQKLKIHQPEWGWQYRHSFIPTLDLIELSDHLRHLEELALDIIRDENTSRWPYEALDAISRFPSLRTVELWFPLGVEPPAPTPILTVFSARHFFRYLRERNGNIQRLILHSGAPFPAPPVSTSFSLLDHDRDSGPSWARHNSVTFICSMAYSSDTDEGRLSVTCPDLSTDLNAQLHHLVQQTDRDRIDPRALDADGLRLKVALDGPLTMDEWEAWKYEQRAVRHKTYHEQNTVLKRFATWPFKRVLK